jgi:peptidoglycan/xylan/chitin deacetylase (PgdA/CDA1 family)
MTTPIKTIPWNGYAGAVSFTFDDALDSQIENLKPILDEMRHVHTTFFVTNTGNNLMRNATALATLANAGHEIGNHTETHEHLSGIGDNAEALQREIVLFADTIEAVLAQKGAKVHVTSFATPYCDNNDKVKSEIVKRHFINRDCGWHGRNEWDIEPDWMGIKAKVWTRSAASIWDENLWDSHVKEGAWLVILNHGVTNDNERDKSDDYAIDVSDIKKQLQEATRDNLWIAPFGTVGAYYRAHFVIDKATAMTTNDGYTIQWEIPNANMPASIPLRVTIDTKDVGENAIVEQNGKVISPQNDRSYIIEFTAKSLNVRKSNT